MRNEGTIDPGASGQALYPVLAASLSRTFAELIIFGYIPLHLYTGGERRILQLALITAVPALVRFAAANVWGAVADVTGRLKLTLLVGLLGYGAAAVGLLFASTGVHAMIVVSMAAALFASLSPAGKALVSLRPGPAGTPGRALAWWLQLESWGWMLGSLAVAIRERLGASPGSLLVAAAGLALLQALWVAWRVPELLRRPAREEPAPAGERTLRAAGVSQAIAGRFAELRDEWRRLYGDRVLALLFGVFGLAVLAGEASFTVFGFYVVGTLGGTESLYGATLTLATALGLVAYAWLTANSRRASPGNLMLTAGAPYIAMYVLMAAAPNALVAAVAFALPLYALIRAGATWAAESLTHASERGGGMGALDGMEAFSLALGAVMAGSVGDQLGLRAVYATCAGVALLLSLLAWKLKARLTRPQASPVAAKA
ncbi:MAG: MFS transporter [Bacillota bacterium]